MPAAALTAVEDMPDLDLIPQPKAPATSARHMAPVPEDGAAPPTEHAVVRRWSTFARWTIRSRTAPTR